MAEFGRLLTAKIASMYADGEINII